MTRCLTLSLLVGLISSHAWADADTDKQAHGKLGALRAGLTLYYGDKGGTYPAKLEDLIPCCASEIPTIQVGGHAATNKVTITDKAPAADKVPDSGGWLYNPKTGRLVIDCKHMRAGTKMRHADY